MVEQKAERLRRAFGEFNGGGAEGDTSPRVFRAPGRVNLIGEHTDYNDGFVLPVAITRDTTVAARQNESARLVRVRSLNASEAYEFDLDVPGETKRGIWLDYVEGVARALESRGARLRGTDLLIESDVPEGAGLSSSAALEISVGLALLGVAGIDFDRVQLALAGQQAEHTYVGANVGIMDQYIAALGRAGHALLIDCRSLVPTLIPVDTTETAIVMCDTHVKHELASSEYNLRRAECERGVELLREVLPEIRALRDVSVAEFEPDEQRLPEPIRRRCRHVITENARTLAAATALKNGNLTEMGHLMAASHRSLRDDYEVSCAELDIMVEVAGTVRGVRGARMTGGGFGGCTVNLVDRPALDEFGETIMREYRQRTGIDASIYVSEAGDGAREIKPDERD
ncbi:MAG TPA: galactokinase [Pyrinomonadaceae bacterium]|nr:galactokinase [Pyrinomonadaceae bacterium]